MKTLQLSAVYLGRFFLCSIFLFSSISEMLDWGEAEKFLHMSVTRWIDTFQSNEGVFSFLSHFVPWLPWILLVSIIFKLVGSIFVVIGYHVRIGASLLIAFLVPATWVVHGFWHVPVQNQPLEMVMFMKNLAILGGLVIVLAFGKGKAHLQS